MPDARRDPSQDADLAWARSLSGLFQALAREKLDQITSEVARELLESPGERDPEVLVRKLISTLSTLLRTVSTSQDALVRNIKQR